MLTVWCVRHSAGPLPSRTSAGNLTTVIRPLNLDVCYLDEVNCRGRVAEGPLAQPSAYKMAAHGRLAEAEGPPERQLCSKDGCTQQALVSSYGGRACLGTPLLCAACSRCLLTLLAPLAAGAGAKQP